MEIHRHHFDSKIAQPASLVEKCVSEGKSCSVISQVRALTSQLLTVMTFSCRDTSCLFRSMFKTERSHEIKDSGKLKASCGHGLAMVFSANLRRLSKLPKGARHEACDCPCLNGLNALPLNILNSPKYFNYL